MGTKVQYKSYFPGYYSMNDNSNIYSWPLFYGGKSITNGPYYNGFLPPPIPDTYLGGDKDVVKHTMLEHEAIFKNQVYELHRVYRIQQDMMNEIKRTEFHVSREDVSLSKNLLRPRIDYEDRRKRQFRRKMFDLQLPADEYIESEDDEKMDYFSNGNRKIEYEKNIDKADRSILPKSNGLADLNEPIQQLEDTNVCSYDDFTGHTSFYGETRVSNRSTKPVDLSNNGTQNRNGRGIISNLIEAGNSKDDDKSKLPPFFKPIQRFFDRPEKNHPEISFNKHLEASPGFNPNVSWSRSVSSWEKQSSDLYQTSMSVQTRPSFNLGKSSGLKDGTAEKIHEAPNFFDMNSADGINLNVVHSNKSVFTIKDVNSRAGNHQSTIPWLKSTPSLQFHDKMENGDGSKKVVSPCQKILGFTIFEESRMAKNDPFSLPDGRKIRALDMNLPCDPETEIVKNQIDLNLCVGDDEEVLDIDLEIPADPESIEKISVESFELVKMAAEAIVSISSSKILVQEEEDDSLRGPLQWFVDVALRDESTSESTDHFETMTLRLKEITEEEYMPRPLFPDASKFEEIVNFSHTRVRRGQSRRGRQRRDFQRDILPGLTTLSRHEITEDIQTFTGLMKATGHSLYSGLARRNSGRNNKGGRGRWRAGISPAPVQNSSLACNVEIGLEDRSLTGWGKTTRRPRRQRIPAGHAVS